VTPRIAAFNVSINESSSLSHFSRSVPSSDLDSRTLLVPAGTPPRVYSCEYVSDISTPSKNTRIFGSSCLSFMRHLSASRSPS